MSRQIRPCTHGGGAACERQGGSGEASHSVGYIHPMPTAKELGTPAGDAVEPLSKGGEYDIDHLEDLFDDEYCKSVLGVSMDTAIHALEVVRKSLYDFDLTSKEGVLKLLGLVPIMDREILADVAGEIWPGYPAQDNNPQLLRLEIKGYLMDFLDGHGTRSAETAPEGLGGPPGTEGGEEGAAGEAAPAEAGGSPEGDAAPDEGSGAPEAPAEQGPPDAEPAAGSGPQA